MRETEISRDGRVLRVRDAGDPGGAVVMYFHGTPGSRLDLSYGEESAAGHGVRLVSFDRPGYGGSAPAPFGLASIGADAHAVADGLGVARFATLGMSGGGPGAPTDSMPVRLHHIVVDAHDLPGLAPFWTQVLGWKVLSDREREIVIGTDENALVGVCFMPVTDPKTVNDHGHFSIVTKVVPAISSLLQR